ncbi:MAG TPA: dockerin type I domain-containing protein [Thermoanaerobaculia bacterium]
MRILTTAAAMIVAFAAAAADIPSVSLYRGGVVAESAQDIVATVDVTGDGIADIVTCGAGAPVVLTKKNTELVTAWHGPWVGCHAFAVGDRNGNGIVDIVTLGSVETGIGGVISVFEPSTSSKAIASINITDTSGNGGLTNVALGDVDSDGQAEIVAIGPYDTFVYGGSSLEREWHAAGHGGSTVHLANIDDDARTEIVINGGTGRVLDAVAKTLKWGYAGGFGQHMDVANVDGDAEAEIVYVYGNDAFILNGDDFSTSSFEVVDGPGDLLVHDVDGNGTREIIIARTNWNGVTAYDTTGATVWALQSYGFARIAAGDVDGDGTTELVYPSSSGIEQALTVATFSTVEAKLRAVHGPFMTEIADLDGDGNAEIVVASTKTASHGAGLVQVLDFATKAVKATLVPNDANAAYYPEVWSLEVGQLDADPALEVLVLGGDPYDGVLYAYDGVTYENQWTSHADWGRSLVVTNMDGDPVDEIVVTTANSHVQVLNGASSTIQWTTTTPANGWLTDMAVGDVDNNGSKDVLIGTSTAVVIHTPATNTSRSLPVSNHSLGSIAATTGRFSIVQPAYSSGSIRTFRGSDLTEEWSCAYASTGSFEPALTYGTIGGQERLLFGRAGTIVSYPLGGTSCPTPETVRFGSTQIYDIHFAEVTGDSRPEMLVDHLAGYEVLAVDSATASRGDVNRDGVVADTDIDTLMRYLLASGPGISPAADVDGNGRIDPADLFYLINYRRGTGPAPIP